MTVSKNIPYYLEIIRNKGNCFHTLHVARKAFDEVKDRLDSAESFSLSVAISHMEIGEGPNELNQVLKYLMKKYANYQSAS